MAGFNLIFVAGARRSGTTLLNNLLCRAKGANGHLAEIQPLDHLLRAFAWSEKNYERITFDFFPDRDAFCAWRRQTCDTLVQSAWRKHGQPKHLVLKNPELSHHAGLLLDIWPSCRLLACVRDPRDQIASELQVAQRRGDTPSEHDVAHWCAEYDRYVQPLLRAQQVNDAQVLLIRYEDLVTDPQGALTHAARHCGLDLSEIVADSVWPIRADLMNRFEQRPSFSPLYGQAVTAEKIGAYRTTLNTAETALIETTLSPYFERFGYARAT